MTNYEALNMLRSAIANRNGNGYSGGCCGDGYSGGVLLGSGRVKDSLAAGVKLESKKLTPEQYEIKYAAIQKKFIDGAYIKVTTTKAERQQGEGKTKSVQLTGKEYKKRYDNTIESRAMTAEVNREAIEAAIRAKQQQLIAEGKKGVVSKIDKCFIACEQKAITRSLNNRARQLIKKEEITTPQQKMAYLQNNRNIDFESLRAPRARKSPEEKAAAKAIRVQQRSQYTPQQRAAIAKANKDHRILMENLDPARPKPKTKGQLGLEEKKQ